MASNFEPPLDYTFMCLTTIGDCLDEQPREDSAKKNKNKSQTKSEETVKKNVNAIRLSNNVLTDWTDFVSTVEKLVVNPTDIEWIDLSFNDITCIDKCVLNFPKLKVLYMHGNGIERINEVDKLASLQHLHSLTLHGNSIEDAFSGYRQYILSRLPNLKNLDFSCVTKSDLASATFCRAKRAKK